MFQHVPLPLCRQVPDSGYSDGSSSVPTLCRPPAGLGGGGSDGLGGGCSDGGGELAGLLRGVLDAVGRPSLSGAVSIADSKDVVIGNVIHLHTESERSPSPAPGHRQVSGAGVRLTQTQCQCPGQGLMNCIGLLIMHHCLTAKFTLEAMS